MGGANASRACDIVCPKPSTFLSSPAWSAHLSCGLLRGSLLHGLDTCSVRQRHPLGGGGIRIASAHRDSGKTSSWHAMHSGDKVRLQAFPSVAVLFPELPWQVRLCTHASLSCVVPPSFAEERVAALDTRGVLVLAHMQEHHLWTHLLLSQLRPRNGGYPCTTRARLSTHKSVPFNIWPACPPLKGKVRHLHNHRMPHAATPTFEIGLNHVSRSTPYQGRREVETLSNRKRTKPATLSRPRRDNDDQMPIARTTNLNKCRACRSPGKYFRIGCTHNCNSGPNADCHSCDPHVMRQSIRDRLVWGAWLSVAMLGASRWPPLHGPYPLGRFDSG